MSDVQDDRAKAGSEAVAPTVERLIRGTVVTPSGLIPNGWLAITGETISAIGKGPAPAAASSHDFGAAYLMPGFIDGQTHAGSYKGIEGVGSTSRAAVAGGVTTLVDMPYDNPEPVTDVATLEAKIAAIETHAVCDYALYGTVPKTVKLADVEALASHGVAAFKISGFENHPIRFPRIPADQVLDLLECLAPTDLPVGLHNEDQEIVLARIARMKRLGRTTQEWHAPSRPIAAEMASTAHFLELGMMTGAHVHIVHFSVARGYELVARYQEEGARVTAELCVHYLALDSGADGARLGSLMKVGPPIRAGEREKLWQQLEMGRVEFVSSDHGSWPVDNKKTASIFDAGAGIPGLETLMPLLWRESVNHGRKAPELVAEYLCEKPAKFFGLWPRKGALQPGADADIAVVAAEIWQFDAAKTHDELNWSPFDGETLPARTLATFVRGVPAFAEGAVVAEAGHGRFIARTAKSATRSAEETVRSRSSRREPMTETAQ